MKKFLKPGRIVIMLTGRYAGKKAVILKVFYEGTKSRKFGHVLVAGIDRAPRRVHKAMSESKISRRISMKPFVKYVNFNHFIPTRYVVSSHLSVKEVIKAFDDQTIVRKDGETDKNRDPLNNADIKTDLRKRVKRVFEDKYKSLDLNDQSADSLLVKFLYKPLRF